MCRKPVLRVCTKLGDAERQFARLLGCLRWNAPTLPCSARGHRPSDLGFRLKVSAEQEALVINVPSGFEFVTSCGERLGLSRGPIRQPKRERPLAPLP